MRLYCFAHSWLSPIQKGIQSLHAAVELCENSFFLAPQERMISDWSSKYKTTIILEGGSSKNLKRILKVFKEQKKFPYTSFHEDKESLNKTMTAVCVVIPERIYGCENPMHLSSDELTIYETIKGCKLAS